MHFKIKFKFIY